MLFGVEKYSCSKAICSARISLMTNFVPKYLGLPHIDRNNVIQDHTTEFVRVLFGESKTDVAITVDDDTYIYIEESDNHMFFFFQRRSYLVRKGR